MKRVAIGALVIREHHNRDRSVGATEKWRLTMRYLPHQNSSSILPLLGSIHHWNPEGNAALLPDYIKQYQAR